MHRVSVLISLAVLFVIPVMYGALLDSSKFRGTVGKLVTGIEVVDVTGGRIAISKAIVRNAIKVICTLVPPFQLLYLFLVCSEQKRALHDLAAGSVVVYRTRNSEHL